MLRDVSGTKCAEWIQNQGVLHGKDNWSHDLPGMKYSLMSEGTTEAERNITEHSTARAKHIMLWF